MSKIISKKDAENDIDSLEVPESVISYVNERIKGALSAGMHVGYFDLNESEDIPLVYARPLVKRMKAAGYKSWLDEKKLWIQFKNVEEAKTAKKGLAGFWRKFCEWNARKGQWLCLLPWLAIWPAFKDDMVAGWLYIIISWMLVICFLIRDEEHNK